MRRGLIICAALAAGALCVWLALPQRAPPEPVYQGKPVSYWLETISAEDARTNGGVFSPQFCQAMRSMGSNAVPFLVYRLRREAVSAYYKGKFNSLATHWHLRVGFYVPSRPIASQALIYIGQPATPGLLKVFEDTSNTNVLNAAAQVLSDVNGMGPRIIWDQFMMTQKTNMSPAAWKRLTNATVKMSVVVYKF